MNIAATLPAHFRPLPKGHPFHMHSITRGLIGFAAVAMTAICFFAITRWLTGFAPDHYSTGNIPIIIHVATVIPAVPLGGYLLLAPKGTPLHKMLGKIWICLMLITAVSITFVRGGTDFSWIHIFVPITLHGAWQAVTSARAGNIAAHKKHLVGMYLGALMIPGLFSFMPTRLMGAWLFG